MIKEIEVDLSLIDQENFVESFVVKFKLELPEDGLTPLDSCTLDKFMEEVSILTANVDTDNDSVDISDLVDALVSYPDINLKIAALIQENLNV